MTEREKEKALQAVFGVSFSAQGPAGDSAERFLAFLHVPKNVTAAHLFKACEILECKPEELFVEWDESGYYPGESDKEFWIEVRR